VDDLSLIAAACSVDWHGVDRRAFRARAFARVYRAPRFHQDIAANFQGSRPNSS
jgi:hypothetical protein